MNTTPPEPTNQLNRNAESRVFEEYEKKVENFINDTHKLEVRIHLIYVHSVRGKQLVQMVRNDFMQTVCLA